MTLRLPQIFLATTALALLCNCATTKPDSGDEPSALIDFPDEKRKGDNSLSHEGDEPEDSQPTSDEVSGRATDLAVEASSPEGNLAPNSVVPDLKNGQNSASSGVAHDQDDEPDHREPVAVGKPNKNVSTAPEATGLQPKTTFPAADSFVELDEVLEVLSGDPASINPEANTRPEFAPANARLDQDPKDASEPSHGSLPEIREAIDELEPSGSSETSGEGSVTDKSTLGSLSRDNPSSPDSGNPERGLAFENVSDQDNPDSSSLRPPLAFSNPAGGTNAATNRENSRRVAYGNPASNESGHAPAEELSLFFGSPASGGGRGLTEGGSRRYLHLNQWLSRDSSEDSKDEIVYLGRSDPETEPALETYIDDSPLVGITPHVPWRYETIAKLLRPKRAKASTPVPVAAYDYEAVRELFARSGPLPTPISPPEDPSRASMDYDNVLRWLDGRKGSGELHQTRLSPKRKYSKALHWLRNDGRRD